MAKKPKKCNPRYVAKVRRRAVYAQSRLIRATEDDDAIIGALARVFGLSVQACKSWPLKNPHARAIPRN